MKDIKETIYISRNMLARRQKCYRHIDRIVENNLKDPNYTKEAVLQELKDMQNVGTRILSVLKHTTKRFEDQEAYLERIEYWINKLKEGK